MRILIALAFILGLGFTSDVNAQKTKTTLIGHVDGAKLLENLPEYDSLETVLLETQKQKEYDYQQAALDFQRQYEEFQNTSASMDPSFREMKEKNLANTQASLQEYGMAIQAELEQLRIDIMTQLSEKVKAAIEKVAKENGYLYIIDSSTGATLYAGGDDIYDLVAAELGIPAEVEETVTE